MASSPKFYDRVLMSSTTTGTGTLTLGSAITGYQAWSVLGDGNSAYYYIEGVDGSGIPSGEWEVGIGTYTTSGTTLSRTVILASSNSGSVVTLSAGTKRVALIAQPAATSTFPIGDMGGRLTLTTAVPVTTADVLTATTIYYTPYKHNRVELWNGSGWVRYAFTERSLALGTLASAKPHDVFLYDNAGTLTLELLIWTDNLNRATALVMQDGVLCKTGALTRRYVGTIMPTDTTHTEDSFAKRYVWNADNRVRRILRVQELTDGWTYASTTLQQANASAANQVDLVVGLAEDALEVYVKATADAGSAGWVSGIGINGTSAISTLSAGGYSVGNTTSGVSVTVNLITVPAVGRQYFTWLEACQVASTIQFYGDANGAVNGAINSGIFGLAVM